MSRQAKNLGGFLFFIIILIFSSTEFLTGKNPGINSMKEYLTPADSSGTVEISMKNEEFVPKEKTISAGTTVKWINNDNEKHNVASGTPDNPNKLFHSKRMSKGDVYTYKFDKPGDYPYFCTYHDGMEGKITVK
ncbi:MAG TPA: plastocyanin/azurin family copper-binding protein [Ignavibacteriaceae bacterium]|nr:plastocyanin/azurin family copper-binding protein [Ignavibacteriaceae bacterium]